MNGFFLAAGLLCMLVGAVHSILGEVLIFRHLRRGGVIPMLGKPFLQARTIGILWASWHICTLFGFAFAAILLSLSFSMPDAAADRVIVLSLMCATAGGALLILIATRGRHPGWVGLMIIAVLTGLA